MQDGEKELESLLAEHAPSRKKANTRHHLITIALSLFALTMGIVKTIPLPILLPESLDLGLTTAQGSFIIAAWPASSILALVLQPTLNTISNRWYLTGNAVLCALGFFSFYLSVTAGAWYLYWAVLARFISGTSAILLSNRAAVGITTHLSGDVNNSTTIWEIFYTGGMAIGAYLGSLSNQFLGFPMTMVLSGGLVLLNAGMLLWCHPGYKYIPEKEHTTKDMYLLHFSLDMIVYCWYIEFCIGACMFFVEGNLSEYYRSSYFKSLAFGGAILGISGIVYSGTAAVIGLMRTKWPVLTLATLELGLIGVAVTLLFIGPVVDMRGVDNLSVSVTTFNLLSAASGAIQLSAMAVGANSLKRKVSAEAAMSVTMNVFMVSYNIGAFVGPLVGGGLLSVLPYHTVFAVGCPFFFLAAIVVGALAFYQQKNGIKLY